MSPLRSLFTCACVVLTTSRSLGGEPPLEPILPNDHGHNIECVSLSGDGKYLAAGYSSTEPSFRQLRE